MKIKTGLLLVAVAALVGGCAPVNPRTPAPLPPDVAEAGSVSRPGGDTPRMPAYQEPVPAAIDGRVDFAPGAPWVPLLHVDWERSEAQTEAWVRTDWNPRGVHLSVVLPRASEASRMPTGRTPEAPFVLHFAFEGGAGTYEIRCVPLVEPVTRMTTRHQSYLFNHRLGANARIGETGHVLCQEASLLGILADSLETRWQPAPTGGLQFEALVPWRTLRRSAPAPTTDLPFRILVLQPNQRAAQWGSVDAMGRLRLLGTAPTAAATASEGAQLAVIATAIRQPTPLAAAFPVPGSSPGAVEFSLIDAQGRMRSRATGDPAGDAAMVRLETRDLEDGRYTLRARNDGRTVGERTVHLIGQAFAAQVEEPGARLAPRLAGLTRRGSEAWMEGHIARARTALRLAVLPERTSTADLERSVKLITDAEAIAAALEAGRRPDPAGEGYGHPAGFAADGPRGPITFVPTGTSRARLTVHAGRETGWSLTPLLYGTFSEPVVYDRPIYNMLYAQALRNSSFEFGHPSLEETVDAFIGYRELEPNAARAALDGQWLKRIDATIEEVSAPWMAVGEGPARFTFECPAAYNDRQCQRITAGEGARNVGIAQIITLPAWRTTRYQLRGFVRSDGTVRSARAILYHDGRPLSTIPINGIGTRWSEFEAELRTPRVEGPLNTFMLAVVFDGPGALDVDFVTLFPSDTIDGFDPQAVAQLRDLKTGWIRWPGGNLASGYRWRDGVGPQDERPSLPNPSWPGLSPNFVGTDEYLRLSRRVGTEPLITVNAGDGTAEEAARWVEYVNGDTTTEMGRLRARNGHPEPYNVRYWNIGNELWGNWQVGYTNPAEHARRYAAFARAMRAVDPSIRVVANAHGGHSESPPEPWNRPLLDNYGPELDILDVHTYVDVPRQPGLSANDQVLLLSAIPLSYEQWLAEFRGDLRRRGLERVRVIVGEYAGSARTDSPETTRIGRLLASAAYLHAFMRQGEYIIGANATEYSPFDPRALQFGRMHPRYDLFRMYATHAGTRPVEAVLETPVRQQDRRVGRDVIPIFNLPLVDAVTLKDATDGSLSISLINRNMTDPVPVEIRLEGFRPQSSGRWLLWGAPRADGVREQSLPAGETFSVTLPPHSVSLLKLRPAAAGARP